MHCGLDKRQKSCTHPYNYYSLIANEKNSAEAAIEEEWILKARSSDQTDVS